MKACLLVAAGGALGAVTRYLIGLIHPKGDFPLTTLLINVLGAVLIGALMGAALNRQMAQEWLLFLKTGVCGGFTTFSTFSLESVALLESGKVPLGLLYMAASLGGCLAGVLVGRALALRLFGR